MPPQHDRYQLTEDQIRYLLRAKVNLKRQQRLEYYRKTGRRVILVSDLEIHFPNNFRSVTISEPPPPGFLIRGKAIVSKFLILIEASAMLGLLLVILTGMNSLRSINQEAVREFILSPMTPTAIIRAIVLPSGHTPPDSLGRTVSNVLEIPAHLRPLAQTYASYPTPTPAIEQGIRIQIPAIKVDAPIVQGDGWEQLKKGVAQHIETTDPGQKGNMVLTGHNDVYGEVFRYLDQLKAGDEIVIYSVRRAYTYIVTGWVLVEPDQVEVMDPTPDATVTLISCYPYLIDNQRIVVTAKLAEA